MSFLFINIYMLFWRIARNLRMRANTLYDQSNAIKDAIAANIM